jgi:translocation and assembly module TamB
MKRLLKILAWTVGGTLGMLALSLAALQTSAGQAALFSMVEMFASTPDQRIKIDGPSGTFPTDLTLQKVEVADRTGTWVTIERARLAWSLRPLLHGRFVVDLVDADKVDLARAPLPPEKREPKPSTSDSKPFELPLSVDIRQVTIRDLRLGPLITGMPSTWTVGAKGGAERGGAARIDLVANRTDGPTGTVKAVLEIDPARDVLKGEVALDEGVGGLATTLMERPNFGTLSTRLTFSGGLADGGADFRIDGADAMTSTGRATWRRDGPTTRLTVNLTGEGPGLRDGPLARLVRAPVTVAAEAHISDTGVVVPSIRITGAPGTIDGRGTFEIAGEKVEALLSIDAGEPAVFALLAPGVEWTGLKATARVEGTLAMLRAQVRLAAASIAAPGPVSLRNLDLALDATVEGVKTAPAARVTLNAKANALALPPVQGKTLPPGDVTLALNAARRADGLITLESLELRSALMALTARGQGNPETLAGEGNAVIDVPSLEPFSVFAGQSLAGRARIELGARPAPGNGIAATWQVTLNDAALPQVPPGLITPALTVNGAGTFDQEQRWTLAPTRVRSDGFTLELSGRGVRDSGEVSFTLADGKLAVLDPAAKGVISGRGTVKREGGDIVARVEAALTDLAVRGVESRRLALTTEATVKGGAVEARVEGGGDLAGQPLSLAGRAAIAADGSLSIPSVDANWASLAAEVRSLTVAPGRADGRGSIRIGRLEDFAALLGAPLRGSIELDAETDPAAGGTLSMKLRGKNVASDGTGVADLTADAAIVDPFGRAEVQATAALKGMRGAADFTQLDAKVTGNRGALQVDLNASGGAMRVTTAARIAPGPAETAIEIANLDMRYGGERATLAGPAKVRLAGPRTTIEPATLAISSGRVRLGGTLDPAASDFAVDITALPLALIAAVSPDVALSGTLNGRVQLRGPLAAPQIAANYAARDIRLRRTETAFLPPASLTGTASLNGRNAVFDGRFTAGAGNDLALKGTAVLPAGNAALSAQASAIGGIDMATLAPLLGPDVRGVTGKLRTDVTANVAGSQVTARGTIRMSEAALSVPSQGTRLERGEGTIVLSGDQITIERLAFRTPGRGEIGVTGTVRIDPQMSLPLQLRIAARNALLANRPDTLLAVSSDLRLSGSTTEGMSLDGTVTVDKAEISIQSARHSANFPTVPVREINKPGGRSGARGAQAARVQPAPAEATPGKPIRLNLTIDAPRGVFVRGRGLDAELGGKFTVTGDTTRPVVLGGTQLRRGTFNLVGQRLNFTRGSVSLVSADKLEPVLDFVATTRSGGTTIDVEITGTPAAPKIALSSKPALPPDEVMSMLLFGKATSSLSPFELAQVVAALAELTGTTSGGGVLDQVRRGLGLDRLSVGSDDGRQGSSSSPAASVEAGRYVRPGVYVGARQGAQAGSSRGVVEIEVLRNTKIEADIGADSTGRVGVKMEWDY